MPKKNIIPVIKMLEVFGDIPSAKETRKHGYGKLIKMGKGSQKMTMSKIKDRLRQRYFDNMFFLFESDGIDNTDVLESLHSLKTARPNINHYRLPSSSSLCAIRGGALKNNKDMSAVNFGKSIDDAIECYRNKWRDISDDFVDNVKKQYGNIEWAKPWMYKLAIVVRDKNPVKRRTAKDVTPPASISSVDKKERNYSPKIWIYDLVNSIGGKPSRRDIMGKSDKIRELYDIKISSKSMESAVNKRFRKGKLYPRPRDLKSADIRIIIEGIGDKSFAKKAQEMVRSYESTILRRKWRRLNKSLYLKG